MTPEQIERELVEFETWASYLQVSINRTEHGIYESVVLRDCWQAWLARAERALEIEQEHIDAISVLKFYASPDTYFAIGFFPDHPCGEFIEDFTICDGRARPGKRAREIFHKYNPKFEVGEPIDTAKNKP